VFYLFIEASPLPLTGETKMPYTIVKEAVNPNRTKFVHILYDCEGNLCTSGTLAECRNVKAGLESNILEVIRTNNTTEIHFKA
jgi:hypothetical protein